MPEISESFYAALKARLAGDAGLSAWATTQFGKAITFLDGAESGPVRDSDYPVVVLDLEDADQEDLLLGSDSTRISATILGLIAWLEEDGSKVLTERLQVHDLLRKALLLDASFENTVNFARLAALDRADTQKPIVAMTFSVRAEYDVEAT